MLIIPTEAIKSKAFFIKEVNYKRDKLFAFISI